jgi:hypothetical protein
MRTRPHLSSELALYFKIRVSSPNIQLINGGQGWIRTIVPLGTDLQSVAFNRSATYPYWFMKAFVYMATPIGLEPTISCVTGRHVDHYTTGPSFNGGR